MGEEGLGFRIFDYFGMLLVLMLTLTRLGFILKRNNLSFRLLIFLSFLTFQFLISAVKNPGELIRPGFAFFAGIFILIHFSQLRLVTLIRLVIVSEFLIVLMSLAVIVQFFSFIFFGYFLSYQLVIGGEPRAFSSIFRPTGLFLEPAHHALSVFMLMSFNFLVKKKFNWSFLIGSVSILLCQSLSGVIFLAILIIIGGLRTSITNPIYIFSMILFLVVGLLFDRDTFVVLNRLLDLSSDHSGLHRFGGLIETFDIRGFAGINELFGIGLTNSYHQYGTSGFAFSLASFGFLGTAAFFFCVLINTSWTWRLYVFVCLSLVLSGAALFTTMFLWAWIGAVLSATRGASVARSRPKW